MRRGERVVVEGGAPRSVSEKAATVGTLDGTVVAGAGKDDDSGSHEAAIVGARLGPYTVVARIGGGGMGRVYRAKHEALGHSVAIKLLRKSVATSRGALDKFFFEAKAAANLQHESIVKAIDFVADSSFGPYIVMELVGGCALSEVIARGPLRPERAVAIAVKIARALGRAHDAGVIHRDVKPGNVMIDEADGDRIKITDFGIAQAMSSVTTGSGATGSPYYMSPEQWAGDRVGPRTDVFSLGVVLYEMLAGRPPFLGSLREIADGLINGRPPDLRVPEALSAIVLRCMEKRPEARFASMSELTAALEGVVWTSSISPPASLRPVAAPRRSIGVFVAVVIAASFLLAFAVLKVRDGLRLSTAGMTSSAAATAASTTNAASAPLTASASQASEAREPASTTTSASAQSPSSARAFAGKLPPRAATPDPAEPDVLRAPTGPDVLRAPKGSAPPARSPSRPAPTARSNGDDELRAH